MKKHANPPTNDPAHVRSGKGVLRYLGESLHSQWRRYRKRLKQCQRQISEEAVHASRIETRRLLATVELLGAFIPERQVRKVRRSLKKHLDAFDQLRDTHMQLGYIEPLVRDFPAARQFRDWLRAREQRFIRETQQAVKKIKTRRLGRRIAAFEQELRRREKDLRREQTFARAQQAIRRAFAKVAHLCRRINPENTATIHRIRIAFKRFRYMVEALAPLLPAITDEQRRAMRGYQSMMGDIQDVEVMLTALDESRRQQPANRKANRLRAELVRRHQRLVGVFLNAAGKLPLFWPPSTPIGCD